MPPHPSRSIEPALDEEVFRVRIDAPEIAPSWEGVFLLEEALDRLAEGAASRLRVVQVAGDAPPFDLGGLGDAGRGRLRGWGERLSREAASPGSLRVGWADGEVRGPLLELLLACDLLFLGAGAEVTLFAPVEGYLPVAGGWTRAIRRMGPGGALRAGLGPGPLAAAEAVAGGLGAGLATEADLEALIGRLSAANGRALGAVADLARRTPGLGEAQAEALERAVFSWCFAAGDPPDTIREFLAGGAGRRDDS